MRRICQVSCRHSYFSGAELSPNVIRTMQYGVFGRAWRRNNRTAEQAEWIPPENVPGRTCQGPCQPWHGIFTQQHDCSLAHDSADLRKGRCTGRGQSCLRKHKAPFHNPCRFIQPLVLPISLHDSRCSLTARWDQRSIKDE